MAQDFPDKPSMLLSPAGRNDWRLAIAVLLLSLAVFLMSVPFAKQQLAAVWAFIPIYQSALAITDLMTFGLLLAQFSITRSRALLVLSCGYLFTACMVVPHTLSYPGLFSPTGLLGAGPQTTAWLYMFWHGGFPAAIIAYVWLRSRESRASPSVPVAQGSSRRAILAGVAVVLTAAFVLTLLATAGGVLALGPRPMETLGDQVQAFQFFQKVGVEERLDTHRGRSGDRFSRRCAHGDWSLAG